MTADVSSAPGETLAAEVMQRGSRRCKRQKLTVGTAVAAACADSDDDLVIIEGQDFDDAIATASGLLRADEDAVILNGRINVCPAPT